MPSEETIGRIVAYAEDLDGVDMGVLRDGLDIARLHHKVEHVIETDMTHWTNSDLTNRQVEILECLYHHEDGTKTPADLSDEVGLTRSAMTSALDSLEKHGYTRRAAHPSDRRMVTLWLTSAGRAFAESQLPDRYRRFCRIIGFLTQRERTVMRRVYGKILDVLLKDKAASEA